MDLNHFIAGEHLIEEKKKELQLISESVEESLKTYFEIDATTYWIEYTIESEYLERTFNVLVKQPEPNTKSLIRLAIQSENLDHIAAAAICLRAKEYYEKTDFRMELIAALEELISLKNNPLDTFTVKRIKTIIYESELYDHTNQKEVMGKHIYEIETDSTYYIEIAERAKLILAKIKSSH